MMQDHLVWTGGRVPSLTVCNALKEDSTAVNGGSGWLSTFSKIPDPSSHRKASLQYVRKMFFFFTHFFCTEKDLVSRPGEKLTFEPTNNKLHSSFALLTTDAKKHNGV